MKKNLVSFLFAIFVIFPYVVSAQNDSFSKDRKEKLTIEFRSRPLGEIFQFLMTKYDISIGFEESTLDANHRDYAFLTNPTIRSENIDVANIDLDTGVKPDFLATNHLISIRVVNGTLEEVMAIIVKQMNNYSWEMNDGVVNIFPTDGRDIRFKELLDAKVDHFFLESGKTINDITINLSTTSAFRTWLSKYDLKFNRARTGPTLLLDAMYGRAIPEDLKFSNITFRDLLNEITRIKRGGWLLRHKSTYNGYEYIDLDI